MRQVKKALAIISMLLFGMVLHAQSQPRRHIPWTKLITYGSAEFDAGTTYYDLHQPCCSEGNPVVKGVAGSPAVFAVVAAGAYAVDWGAPKLAKFGKAIRVVAIAGHLFAGAHNIKLVEDH